MTAPHNFSNTASVATLAGSLSASDTAVVLDSFANFPAPPFTATIARNQPTEEIVLVTEVTGFTVTLTRGYDGTSAQAQSPGATFEHTAVAKHFREASAHAATTASAHGTTSAVVGVDDVQTLSNKTVVALLALATAGAPALTANAPSGVTSKLLSLKQAGVEKAFVDYLGNLTALAVTGATGSFSGAVSAGALTAAATTLASLAVTGNATVGGTLGASGNASVGGTLAVTGATTLAALAAASGAFSGTVSGATATAAGHLVRKDYADALGAAAATASTIMRRDASGNTAVNKITAAAAASASNELMRKGEVDAAIPAAIAAKVITGNSSVTTTAGQGQMTFTVPYGATLASTPKGVWITPNGTATEFQYAFWTSAVTTTNFALTVRWTSAGGAPTSGAITFTWLAIL